MKDIWWLWEGAAVRLKGDDWVLGRVEFFLKDGQVCGDWLGGEPSVGFTQIPNNLTPIENPAVMLAPDDATHVEIDNDGVIKWRVTPARLGIYTNVIGPIWPQCPDDLKGKTWVLPGRGK